MKKILLSVAISLLSLNAYCQSEMSYSKVITAEGKDAQTLYSNAKTWFASEFKYPGKVIQIDDPAQFMISGKSNTPYSKGGLAMVAYEGWVHFNILMQCKDGRMRVQLLNISHENKPSNAKSCNLGLILDTDNQFTQGINKGSHNKVSADIKAKMKVLSEEIFLSLENFIKNSTSIVNDEW